MTVDEQARCSCSELPLRSGRGMHRNAQNADRH